VLGLTPGISQCSLVAIAMMLEYVHDISIFACKKYVNEES